MGSRSIRNVGNAKGEDTVTRPGLKVKGTAVAHGQAKSSSDAQQKIVKQKESHGVLRPAVVV
jgi:hypothetical protein